MDDTLSKEDKVASKIFKRCMIFSIILLPFSSLPLPFSFLGELKTEGAVYPLLFGYVIFIFLKKRFKSIEEFNINNVAYKIIILIFMTMILSGACNCNRIVNSFIKGRSGVEKYIFQIIMFVILICVYRFICFSLSYNQMKMEMIARALFISFLICFTFSILEILKEHSVGFIYPLYSKLDLLIHGDYGLSYRSVYGRIRSVSGEASWFAMYASIALPWVIGYCWNKKRKKILYIVPFLFIYLIYLTKSRTAYVLFIIQLVIYMLLKFKDIFKKNKAKGILTLYFIMLSLNIFVVINLYSNTIQNSKYMKVINTLFEEDDSSMYKTSNDARYGMQRIAFRAGKDKFILGFGIGQFGFNMGNYVEAQELESNEIRLRLDSTAGTPWATAHSIYARLFAELGGVGFLLWIYLLLYTLFRVYKKLKRDNYNIYGQAITNSLIGCIIVGLNYDSFRFMGYWLTLGIAWAYIDGNIS